MSAFTVAGVEIRHTFEFPDPEVPGRMLRVAARHVSPRQMQMDGRTPAEDVAKVLAHVGDPDAVVYCWRDQLAEEEYERALRAVVAAAARCGRSYRGEPFDPIDNVLAILHGIVRHTFPERDDHDAIAEAICASRARGRD